GCKSVPAAEPSAGAAGEVALGKRPRLFADPRPEPPAGEVVRRDVDAAVDAREPGLISGVVVPRPLQRHRLAGPPLELEVPRRERLLEEAAGEIGAARVGREHLGSRAAEGAVPGDEPRKGGRDESRLLVGHPALA